MSDLTERTLVKETQVRQRDLHISSRNVAMIPTPGGPLITEDAAGVFTLVGILKAETSTREISDEIII